MLERMIKFVAFDMDGVLTDCKSSWYFIHKHFGTDNMKNIELYNNGIIDYPTFVYLDVKLWLDKKPDLKIYDLIEIYKKMPLMKNAKETVDELKKMGIKVAILTGGLDILAKIVCEKVGIDEYYANGLKTYDDGRLTGEGIIRINPYHKDDILKKIMDERNLKKNEVAVVGDGEVDIPMFKLVETSIAFDPITEEVERNAKYVIKEKDLKLILPIIQKSSQNHQ